MVRGQGALWPVLALALTACQDQSQGVTGSDGPGQGNSATGTIWVTGYYTGYGAGLYPPEVIDFSGLTHIAMGAILPNADGTLNTDFYVGPVDGPALARRIGALAHQNGKKAILMIGGAGSDNWQTASSDANRARFVQSLKAAMTDLGYDGLDIDWEPVTVDDAPALRALSRDLRQAMPSAILTIPVGFTNENILQDELRVYGELAPLYDRVNIMSYDTSSAYWWEESWHSSPLFGETPRAPSSIDADVKHYLALGVSANKLGIGIGFFGSCWKGVTQPHESVRGRAPNTVMGQSDNVMSYTNIMTQYFSPSVRKWDDIAKVPYLSSAAPLGPQGCNFVSYDDEQSIAEKGAYVKKMGLGGVIVWNITEGTLPDKPMGQRDPLMAALKKSFLD